jgi:hypothetical protein
LERGTIEEHGSSLRSSQTKYPDFNTITPNDQVLTVMSFDRGMPLRRMKSSSRRFSDPIGKGAKLNEKALSNLKTLIDDLENIDMDPVHQSEE